MSFWSSWSWDAGHLLVVGAQALIMALVWRIHRGLRTARTHTTEGHCHCITCRHARAMQIEAGKPPAPLRPDLAALSKVTKHNRCTNCQRRYRRHVHHPGRGNPLPHTVTLCDGCIEAVPAAQRNDPGLWISFDLVTP